MTGCLKEGLHFKWKLPVPWALDQIKPELHIYTSKALDTPWVIKYDDDIPTSLSRLNDAKLFHTTSLIFVTHGFENDVNSPWVPEMKNEILAATPNATVILLDWGGGASIGILKYTQAAANTQTVGAWLASVAKDIRKLQPDQSMKIWGIAHSLGAHLMGLAARQSDVFDRVTALDPAGPSFEKVNQENRLRSTDAKMVDVIHTDGYDSAFDPEDWFAPVNHYGTLIPLGKIDFYPNWGYCQPGASYFTIAGSHHRAIEYFIWSIKNPGKFVTNTILVEKPSFEKPVKDVKYVVERVEMGYHFKQNCDGLFYIKTQCEVPWVVEENPGHDNKNDHDHGHHHHTHSSSEGGDDQNKDDDNNNNDSGYFNSCRIL